MSEQKKLAPDLRAGAVSVLAAAALAAVDQLCKVWATAALAPDGAAPLLPGVLELRYVLSGRRWLLLGGTGAILAVLLLMLFFRRMPRLERLTWVLVLGGGVGNFIDRARSGVVVDYLNFQFISFPVFNFADICVTVGVALLVLLLAADLWQEHKAAKAAPPHGDA